MMLRHLNAEDIQRLIRVIIRNCPCAAESPRALIQDVIQLADDIVTGAIRREQRQKIVQMEESKN